jgi:hypothetical protein
MDQSEVILKRAIALRTKLDKLAGTLHQIRINNDTLIGKLDIPGPVDYGSLPLPGTADLVGLANSADNAASILEAFIFQAFKQ